MRRKADLWPYGLTSVRRAAIPSPCRPGRRRRAGRRRPTSRPLRNAQRLRWVGKRDPQRPDRRWCAGGAECRLGAVEQGLHPKLGLGLREVAVAPRRPDFGWHFVQGLLGWAVVARVPRGRGTAGGRREVGHAVQCGWLRAPSQASSAGGVLETRPVCTRVRLDDACGDADEESDTVQQPSPPSLTMPTLDSSFAGSGALGATTWTCPSASLDAGTAPRTGPTGRDARRTRLDRARMGCAA